MDFYSAYRPGLCPRRCVHATTRASGTPRRTPNRCSEWRGSATTTASPGGFPGAHAVRLLHRGHLDAGCVARRRRGRARWTSWRPRPTCFRSWWSVRRCATTTASTTPPWSSTAARCSGWHRSRTCRPIGSSTSAARWRRATTRAASSASAGESVAEVPFGPDLFFAATDLPGFVLHVEICEDMFVPIPPSAEAALAGATVMANLSGSPITIGRAEDRACWPGRRRRAALRPTCTPRRAKGSRRRIWRGTARR